MPQNLQSNQVQAALVRRVIENLVIDCASNTQVIIRQNSMVGSDDGAAILVAAADITVDITVSGVNGLDTGVEAGNTWYYIWMIFNPTTGLTRGLLSTSPTSPILPSGYTMKRLVGAVRNDGTSNFRQFKQVDARTDYRAEVQIFSQTFMGVSWFSIDLSGVMPAVSSKYRVWYNHGHSSGSVGGGMIAWSMDQVNAMFYTIEGYNSGGAYDVTSLGITDLLVVDRLLPRLYVQASGSAQNSLVISSLGFTLSL